MRDRAEAYRDHQQALRGILSNLRDIDRCLGEWVERIEPDPDGELLDQLRAGADCVRTDLLADAVETLSLLVCLAEGEAIRRRRASALLAEHPAPGR